MARFYGPDAGEYLRERQFRGNKPVKIKRHIEAPYCENCGRETEFLFDGFVLPLGRDNEPQEWSGTVFEISVFELGKRGLQPKPGKVCLRCRPPSNLEIAEIRRRA